MSASPQPLHYGIAGGGMLGLSLALRLAQRGARVTVLESGRSLGGLADAWRLGDFVWDRHYHVVLRRDLRLLALLRELGLETEVRWKETRTGFYVDGSWHSLSNLGEFLAFPPLGAIDKLRLGATILHASRIRDGRALEEISAVEWLRTWSGRQATERLWIPLLRAKLGERYADVSASFIWTIIKRMYGARRSGSKREELGYVEGGYARVLDRLADVLRDAGVTLRVGERVERVDAGENGVDVALAQGAPQRFDRLVVTAPAPVAAAMLPGLRDDERARLAAIEYQGVVCASVLCRNSVSPFYVTNITDAWVPFTGVIEMTALVDRLHFGGNTLLYLPRYAAADDALWARSDAEVEDEFLGALERMAPHFRRADVICCRVSRARHVMPVPTLRQSSRLPAMRTSLPGVYTVNSAQIVDGTLNTNETIELGERAVAEIWTR